MKTNLFYLLLLCLCPFSMNGAASERGAMHPLNQLKFVEKQIKKKVKPYYQAYQQLIVCADSLLQINEHALADYAVPGFYQDPKGHRANSSAFSGDAFSAYTCALAYRLSHKKVYGEKACYFLNAWGHKNKKYSDYDGELVMAYNGTAMMMAAELMNNTPVWQKADEQQFRIWVSTVYRQAVNAIRNRVNNWADWGRFGSLLCATFLEDDQEVAENIRLIKADLSHRIAPDGHMPEEVKREGNGLWYTYFSLAPITASCWTIYNYTGENLFTSAKEGTLIKNGLDYLLYHVQHPEDWKWWKNPYNGHSRIDQWPENLLEAMDGIYKDFRYQQFATPYRPITYDHHHYAWTFPTLLPLSLTDYSD